MAVDKHVISIPPAVHQNMEAKLHGYRNATSEVYYFPKDGSSHRRPTIHKVPESIRQAHPDAYTPRLISIGPFHRSGAPKQIEPLKWRYLHDLLQRSPETNSIRWYVQAVERLESEARRQYTAEVDDMPSSEFVEMLVLDGCFILEFLFKRATGPVGFPWSDVKWNLPFLRHDLLLLENQIPFFVLEALFDMTDGVPAPSGSPTLKLLDFALHYVSRGKIQRLGSGEEEITVHHLLHLHHLCQVNFVDSDRRSRDRDWWSRTRLSLKIRVTGWFFYLISILLMFKIPRHVSSSRNKEDEKKKYPRAIPSARELKAAGVSFRRKKQEKGKECCLSISFTEDGKLKIPLLPLQQSSISSFLNLIAFEQSCGGGKKEEQYFTAYTVFMDQLIDTPEDVEILEKCKIIESKLGSDDDVARMFNGIGAGASLDYDRHYLKEIMRRIDEHCESDRNRWRAELVHSYFHNPWAVASVLAALFILVFTGTQTVYSALSYYHN